jgi:hypothetical protein
MQVGCCSYGTALGVGPSLFVESASHILKDHLERSDALGGSSLEDRAGAF